MRIMMTTMRTMHHAHDDIMRTVTSGQNSCRSVQHGRVGEYKVLCRHPRTTAGKEIMYVSARHNPVTRAVVLIDLADKVCVDTGGKANFRPAACV